MAKDDKLRPSLLSEARAAPGAVKGMQDAQLQHRHYSAIGQVAAAWAYFEAIIDTWLIHFAEVKFEIGVCFTAQMVGPRPRMDSFIALTRHLGANKKWNKILEDFAKDVQKLAEQRNRAVHDVWELSEPATPHRLEATARRSLRIMPVHVPTEELMNLTRNIYDLHQRFEDIASEIFTDLHRG